MNSTTTITTRCKFPLPFLPNCHPKQETEMHAPGTASEQVGATPTGAYSWRVSNKLHLGHAHTYRTNICLQPPSPPHLHVPQVPDDKQSVLPAYDESLAAEADRDILRMVTAADHVAVPPKDWRYDWRRKAQPIVTFLHLGPSSAARDIEYLKSEGITMLLAVRDSRSANVSLFNGQKAAGQLGIEAATIDVDGYQKLIAAFPRAIEIINRHLISQYRKYNPHGEDLSRKTWGKVLVFCESGNERSATVVAAYMMSMYNQNLVQALQYIQAQRFCVAFDDTMKNFLLSWQDILEARRTVAGAAVTQHRVSNGNGNGASPPKIKRGREEVIDDEEMDLDDADDEARFMGRTSFTPFHDRS